MRSMPRLTGWSTTKKPTATKMGTWTPFRIVALYALLGVLWILFSDRILLSWVADPDVVNRVQTYKGWFYVLVTALLLYALICKMANKLRQSEEKQNNLTKQLAQAQKLESVGRLAGGVAHDFNNMLSVIIGYAELAALKANPSRVLEDDELREILKAARRATDITQQLLAFARQQTIAPKVIDLNETIERTLRMLRRLIGENIDLAWLPGSALWLVKMDTGQIDQILANLCVNARDAIADVGRIAIETQNIAFDERYCKDHEDLIPGEFVQLSVSDTGCGIAAEIQDKVFEPFFTTKGQGRGTGLGLATVYGIVKQNNGFINIYSEPGQGTTLRIYLPRHDGQPTATQRDISDEIPLGHKEVVLVVEDNASILRLAEKMLKGLRYQPLCAGTPDEALRLADQYAGQIHLLLTDVIMPEMNGRDLAQRLQAKRPQMKCIYMSGYTVDVIAHQGVLDKGMHFIQKPFSRKDMAIKIDDLLRDRQEPIR